MIDFKKMPKVELHLHLDGAIRKSTLNEFYKKDVTSEIVAKDKCLDLKEYLTKFSLPKAFLQTRENLERACLELSEDLENDGVIYAEVRFAPNLHTSILSLEEVVETVIESLKKGHIKIGVILCMLRNDSFDNNLKVIDIASKYLNKGVVAIDLAGDEKAFKTSLFENLFIKAQEKNIPFTIHAGEINQEDSIKVALDLKTKRLGHGIAVINYKDLLSRVVNDKILLEICPTSNVQTNIVDKYQNHPIKKLQEAGCLISINTDNRTVSNITLTEEYQKLALAFNFSLEDFCHFNINAINYSWLSQKEKQEKIKVITEYLKINL